MEFLHFTEYWMDHASTNGMSVVAIDEKDHKVAGALIAVDFSFEPEGFEERYTNEKNNLTPLMSIIWQLDKEAVEKMPELGEKGKTVDFFMLGIHPDYRGRKLASPILKTVTKLAKENGTYKYAIGECTNFISVLIAKKQKWTIVHEIECKDWLYKGKPFYTNCKKPNGKMTFVVLDLQAKEKEGRD